MSTVYLYVGQCGLQIGKEFWKDAAYSAINDVNTKHVTFSLSNEPRCLFIDSERKVIQKFIEETKKSKSDRTFVAEAVVLSLIYHLSIQKLKIRIPVDCFENNGQQNIFRDLKVSQNSIRCRKGCGSNWAMGYCGLEKDILGKDLPKMNAGFGQFMVDSNSSMLEVCLEAIRMKVEKCDSFSGFLGLNSLAGGTGSGWGARLCEEISNNYPTSYRLWNVVAPYTSGETPTQHYNQLLSLSKLQECADAVVIFQNDSLLDQVSAKRNEESSSLEESNRIISKTMQTLYFPISSLTSRVGGISIGLEPWELVRSVAPMPSLKFLQTSFSEARDKDSLPDVWDRLTKSATSSLSRHRSFQDQFFAALCVCRGTEVYCVPDISKISNKLKTSLRCVNWNPFPVDIWWDEPRKNAYDKLRVSKSITLCYNCSSIESYLQKVVSKAQTMYDSGAYLHWYTRHGVTRENFDEAFYTLKNIVEEYKQL